jgi:DNA-3-methyladenine glycosylase II
MEKYLTNFEVKKALKHLKSSDSVISSLIEKHGSCTIKPLLDNPFHALASSIIGQQLSAHAARAIKNRLFNLIGDTYLTPERLLKITPAKLRSAGLSLAKATYILNIAKALKKDEFSFSAIINKKDEDVIDELVALPGVGRWTAEMFLIFGLGRPDILSVNDAGLKKAFKLTYQLKDTPSESDMIKLSANWRPYRSVASWYLWRTLD